MFLSRLRSLHLARPALFARSHILLPFTRIQQPSSELNNGAMTTYQKFGGDVNIPELPAEFAAAVNASIACQAAQATPAGCDLAAYQAGNYDETIGSAQWGYGFCADPKYRQMTYCACVNAPIANPECIFQACTNSPHAYVNTKMMPTVKDRSTNCPKSVNCQQIFEMGGSGNVADRVSQSQNCGGVVNNFVTNIEAHPALAIAILVLIISVMMLISGSGNGKRDKPVKTLPPPELVMPFTL